MTKPAEQTPLAFTLINEIGIINQLSSAAFAGVLPDGLNQPQFSVLNRFVRLGGSATPAELASAFQVTRGAMTNTLQRLEAKGCVVLMPSARDGRSKVVKITAKGRRLREKAIAATAPELAKMIEALGAQEIAQALPFLQRMREWFDANR